MVAAFHVVEALDEMMAIPEQRCNVHPHAWLACAFACCLLQGTDPWALAVPALSNGESLCQRSAACCTRLQGPCTVTGQDALVPPTQYLHACASGTDERAVVACGLSAERNPRATGMQATARTQGTALAGLAVSCSTQGYVSKDMGHELRPPVSPSGQSVSAMGIRGSCRSIGMLPAKPMEPPLQSHRAVELFSCRLWPDFKKPAWSADAVIVRHV